MSAVREPLLQNREILDARLKEIPMEPGVYLMRDRTDNILYVGKSKRLRSRVRSYFRFSTDLTPRKQQMVMQICEIEFIVTDTEAEALALEDNLIKTNQPPTTSSSKTIKNTPTSASLGPRTIPNSSSPATAACRKNATVNAIAITAPTPTSAACATPYV